ncbi:MAG: hypothetical protein BroJett025_04210 [Patescibacteria group bacterium]|nr:MAG: hypothetical protein BroJett025_04210 [Patescibacteria group bacterium]
MKKHLKELSAIEILQELGAKPSISEEHGLALLKPRDLNIFSPGISTAGFAEIRMAQSNQRRKIIATTIDQEGLLFAQKIIAEIGLDNQIDARLEDLRKVGIYPNNFFNFIYARLVLHYLPLEDLTNVLNDFFRILKPGGRLFVVVRSTKNIPDKNDITFDPITKITSIPHKDSNGKLVFTEKRYFHTVQSITDHLKQAGFRINHREAYKEQLYSDFMRAQISDIVDHVIEVHAVK